MSKQQKKDKDYTLRGCVAGAGLIKGGSVGLTLFGTAIGMPLFVPSLFVGSTVGGIVGASYKKYHKSKKSEQNR